MTINTVAPYFSNGGGRLLKNQGAGLILNSVCMVTPELSFQRIGKTLAPILFFSQPDSLDEFLIIFSIVANHGRLQKNPLI